MFSFLSWGTFGLRIQIMVAVVFGTFLLILLSRWTERSNPRYTSEFIHHCRKLIKQAVHFLSLSQQDINPIWGLLHASSALDYARVANTLQRASEIQRITKVNVVELKDAAEEAQQQAIAKLQALCPNAIADTDVKLITSAGMI